MVSAPRIMPRLARGLVHLKAGRKDDISYISKLHSELYLRTPHAACIDGELTGEARGVGIRPRRRIFYARWLANHSFNRYGWSATTAEALAVLARARAMCLDYLHAFARAEVRGMTPHSFPACYGLYQYSARKIICRFWACGGEVGRKLQSRDRLNK